MSRPILIRNGSSSVKNVKDKSDKLIEFGNQYHIYFGSLDIPTFDLTSDNYGGVVTYKNKPVGVIGVPSSVTGDNSIRIISLFNMNINNPETGTTDLLSIKNPDKSFLNYKTQFTGPYWDNNNSLSSYTPPFVDGWHDYNLLILLSDNLNAGNWRTSSTVPASNLQERGYSPAALCIWRYNPISDVLNMLGYWYMPSMHELIEEANHLSEINAGVLTIKNTYDVGIGRIPYDTSAYNNDKSYYASRYIGSLSNYGGNSSKYDVYFKYNRSQYYATSADAGLAQAWCKLIKDNGKWILDPTYHID